MPATPTSYAGASTAPPPPPAWSSTGSAAHATSDTARSRSSVLPLRSRVPRPLLARRRWPCSGRVRRWLGRTDSAGTGEMGAAARSDRTTTRPSETGAATMKLTITAQVSVDGVMQGPGGPEEDERGRFERGGWAHFDDEASTVNPCLHLESVLGVDSATCGDARIRF